MKKQFNIIVIIALTTILSFGINSNYNYHDGILLIDAQTIDSDNNTSNTDIIKLENIPAKQVRVGDIDISYKPLAKEIQFC